MTQLGRPTEETSSIDLDHYAIINWAARGFGILPKPNWSGFFDQQVAPTVDISRGTFFNAIQHRKVRQPAHEAILCLILEKGWFSKYADYQKQTYMDAALDYLTKGRQGSKIQDSGGCRFCPVYGEENSTQRLEVLTQVGWGDHLSEAKPEVEVTGSNAESILRYFPDRELGTFQVLTRPWANGQAHHIGVFGEDDRLKLYGHVTAAELAQFKEALKSVKIDGN